MAASDIQKVIALESAQIGKPYQWGGIGPDAFDCSGLQQWAFVTAGYPLSRTTYTQILQGSPVASIGDLLPGDLIFPDAGHVQLYIGNGEIIEAPYTGSQVRRVKMWGFWQARRYLDGGGTISPNQILGATDASAGTTPAASSGNLLSQAMKAPAWLAKNYLRILEAIGGILAIIVGVLMINKDTFKEVGVTVAKYGAIAA